MTYAEGGRIPADRTNAHPPMIIDNGYILIDADTYDLLGPDRLRELNGAPNAEIEIYLTADQLRARHPELAAAFDKINNEGTDRA